MKRARQLVCDLAGALATVMLAYKLARRPSPRVVVYVVRDQDSNVD